MKYLDKYPNWIPLRYPLEPDEESVNRWLQYINIDISYGSTQMTIYPLDRKTYIAY